MKNNIDQKIIKIIEGNPLAFSTICNNAPYTVAVAYSKIIDNKYLLITDNYMKSTIENILLNDNVSLVTWNKDYEGVQILGKAKYYKKGKWVEICKKIKENKNMPVKGAILIKINKIIKSK